MTRLNTVCEIRDDINPNIKINPKLNDGITNCNTMSILQSHHTSQNHQTNKIMLRLRDFIWHIHEFYFCLLTMKNKTTRAVEYNKSI